jgi:biopolymer transport protein ExbD
MKHLSDALSEGDDRPDMTPLIDCMMVMLLFFIVTATFSESAAFEADVPTANHASLTTTGSNAVVVTISADGNFLVDGTACATEELFPEIRKRLGTEGGNVVVRGDRHAPYERIVLAVDAAHAAGATGWALAVNGSR